MGRQPSKPVTILLSPGENIRPAPLFCANVYCGRRLFNVSRDVQVTIHSCRGIHWSDAPSDVTVVEVKCHHCKTYHYLYTPESLRAAAAMETALEHAIVNT